MAWRVAESLEVLRKQINALSPNRNIDADGGIGDEAHATRDSDHNPWVRDGKMGVVTARDFTHDPANGIDARKLAECLLATRDPRIKYIISNRQIASSETSPWKWRKYSGKNPHTHHFHISVQENKPLYDSTKPWDLSGFDAKPDKSVKPTVSRPLLKRGSKGDTVKVLQRLLSVTVDGDFGPKTEAAVKAIQKRHGLVPDGIVGVYTWEALL